MTIEIDDDIPLPKRKGRPLRATSAPDYPFKDLKIGQSFFVPAGKQSTVSSAKVVFETRFPTQKFATRYLDNDPKHKIAGVRVWRVQ